MPSLEGRRRSDGASDTSCLSVVCVTALVVLISLIDKINRRLRGETKKTFSESLCVCAVVRPWCQRPNTGPPPLVATMG